MYVSRSVGGAAGLAVQRLRDGEAQALRCSARSSSAGSKSASVIGTSASPKLLRMAILLVSQLLSLQLRHCGH